MINVAHALLPRVFCSRNFLLQVAQSMIATNLQVGRQNRNVCEIVI